MGTANLGMRSKKLPKPANQEERLKEITFAVLRAISVKNGLPLPDFLMLTFALIIHY